MISVMCTSSFLARKIALSNRGLSSDRKLRGTTHRGFRTMGLTFFAVMYCCMYYKEFVLSTAKVKRSFLFSFYQGMHVGVFWAPRSRYRSALSGSRGK